MVIKKILRAFDNVNNKLERVCRKTGSEIDLNRLLQRNNVNINLILFDDDEHTLIHLATLNGFTGCVDILLKYGANPDIKNNKGTNAWELAKKRRKIFNLLEKYRR